MATDEQQNNIVFSDKPRILLRCTEPPLAAVRCVGSVAAFGAASESGNAGVSAGAVGDVPLLGHWESGGGTCRGGGCRLRGFGSG